ncbi:MAG: 3-dehydroquinate dehydratase [Ignavibacteria bacterium CG_4_8_14_3_um_filter_37_9]|nr:MAG: 3-dehydroquinate dehydratase [Ignavibacteria bacterium CG22_combo_CG10-13_8_21_14_all_37_15]PIS46087.1 MAG: 3-dehydroquinate dehydratase [Ignavibacteria bacterium CG08_land_8_20_14_0_20_37_9]PIW99876.1 MAG: 3-dehydroquinate dehydratase [Ignavibacteria bacterium CG_4_8_14_3_um_filter_37_9]
MKILIINGPNLNLLGKRDPEKYGRNTLKSIESLLLSTFPDVSFNFYQSNIEGEIVSKIQSTEKEFDALIINPGGYAHTSVAIHDALMECKIPKVEVHLSHLAQREDFRQVLITARAVNGYISGFKEISYLSAVFTLQQLLKSNA